MKNLIVFLILIYAMPLYAGEPQIFGGGGTGTGDMTEAEYVDGGFLATDKGGIGVNVSAVSGLMGLNAGTYVDVDSIAELVTYAGLGAYAATILAPADEATFKAAVNLEAGTDYPAMSVIPYLVGADIAVDATGDTSPTVTIGRVNVFTSTGAVEIASFTDSSGDYSEFSNGQQFVGLCQDADITIDVTGTEIAGAGNSVKYTCSATVPTVFLAQYDSVNTRFNIIAGIPWGYSNPTTLALASITISGTDDAISNEGSAGIVKTGIGGDTIAIGDVVCLNDADARWELADNDATADPQANEAKGIAISTSTDGTAITVLIYGKMRLDSWTWNDNEGQPLYLSATAGDLTETRPTSATEAPQIVAYIESDDEIFVNPQPIDFSVIRTGTDEDGRTLTCLEATNTWWDGDGTYITPALSTCPTIDFTVSANSAADLTFDPNAADDTIVNGVANADGENWSSPDAINDTIKCSKHDADTLRCIVNGTWTAE